MALEKELKEECARELAYEVVARIEEAVGEIHKAADCSHHVKGTIVSTIRKALVTISTAARTLVERVTSSEAGAVAEEMASLREEVHYLRQRCEAASKREALLEKRREEEGNKEPDDPSPLQGGKNTSGSTAGQPAPKKRKNRGRTHIHSSSESFLEDLSCGGSEPGVEKEKKRRPPREKRKQTRTAKKAEEGE